MGFTKPCTHLHPAASTSTQFYPPPPISFQPPPSFLQRSQQYLNQNIARNWAVSPNLGRKIQSCPFWLKIRSHDILEVLIPNPDLDFWISDRKIHFSANLGQKSVLSENWHTWYLEDANSYSNISFMNFQLWIPFGANLGQKCQSCPFYLKIGEHGIFWMLTLIPTLVFWIPKPKFVFKQI